jgi:Tfp pilus assembly protein PilW
MPKKYYNGKNKFTEGFTIIETMIAIAIFLIVIVVGIGALLNAHLVNRKSQDVRSIVDSLSYTMEDMSRNIRTGYNYKCLENGVASYVQADLATPASCQDGFGIAFESSTGDPTTPADQWVYYVSQDGKIMRSTAGLDDPVQMTPDEVVLSKSSYSFLVFGAEGPSVNSQQPLVIIRLNGVIKSGGITTPFSLQTAVSQRMNDI